MIEIINSMNFDEKVLSAEGEVVVEFFATWCPHCQRMAPIVDELADELFGRVTFFRVDIDESPDLASEYAPNGFPTFVVIEGGRVMRDVTGEQARSELLRFIEE
jgi:thioredoxin 1